MLGRKTDHQDLGDVASEHASTEGKALCVSETFSRAEVGEDSPSHLELEVPVDN